MVVARRSFSPEAEIMRAGEYGGGPYTLWDGWAYRYRDVPSDEGGQPRQQIVDIVLPGDMFGIEAALMGRAGDPVRALTDATICAHDPRAFANIFTMRAELARGLLETQLRDRLRTDARLTALGQGTGAQRAAHLMLEIRDRLIQRGKLPESAAASNDQRVPFPLRRRHWAAALGMSGTHVARSLAELDRAGLAHVEEAVVVIGDPARLTSFCGYATPPSELGRRSLL
jgi:CRP-like cAMP-binding protein